MLEILIWVVKDAIRHAGAVVIILIGVIIYFAITLGALAIIGLAGQKIWGMFS